MSGRRGRLHEWTPCRSIQSVHAALPSPDRNWAGTDRPQPFSTRFASVYTGSASPVFGRTPNAGLKSSSWQTRNIGFQGPPDVIKSSEITLHVKKLSQIFSFQTPVRPSLLLPLVLGTVYHNMSRPRPLCLFSEVASTSRLSSSGVPSHDFYRNFCSACTVTELSFSDTWHLHTCIHTYIHRLHKFTRRNAVRQSLN